MSRRIDIELTSDRGDGSWTWRAAGAKQPKGVVRGDLLPAGATVGQELRAEIDTTLDGTEVLAVQPPKEKNRSSAETLELITRPVSDDELVTSKLAGRGGRDRDRGDRGDRRGGRGDRGDRGPRREGDRGPRGRDGDRPRGRDGEGRGGPGGDRPRGEGRPRPEGDRGPRPERPRRERPAPPPKPKAKRLRPGRTHRKAALDALAPEEQVIAEQVLRGGIPAVRQAVDKQNEQVRADGGREIAAEPLLAVAERLLPALRAAEWRDRAEAALADLAELDLRDLRSVVVAAETGAKDAETLELADQLRAGLTARVDAEQSAWLAELEETLKDGRVVRALRLSSRPPKAGAPLPAELASRLAEAASGALTAETLVDRWATVLDALSFSPVRLTVAPASKPETPGDELVAAVTRLADRVPKVAEAFGIDPSAAPARRRSRGPKPPAKGKDKPRPPKPPKPPKPEAPTPPVEADAPAAEETPAAAETPVVDSPATEAPATEAPAPETNEVETAEVETAEPDAPTSEPAPEPEPEAEPAEPEPTVAEAAADPGPPMDEAATAEPAAADPVQDAQPAGETAEG
jgi:hypothetical protein